jgi:hypothetical protein
MCKRFSDYQAIVFSDAFDVLFYGSKEDVLEKIPETGVLVATERNCWPDTTLGAGMPGSTDWKYANGGLLAGKPKEILQWFDEIESHPIYKESWCNQGFFNVLKYSGSHSCRFDEATTLFYCLHSENNELQFDGETPVNSVLGTHPNFIHANGKWPWPPAMVAHDNLPINNSMLGSVAVAIGLVFSGRPIPPEFAWTYGNQNYPLNTRRAVLPIKGMEVGIARQSIAELAVSSGAKYLWFPDDDMGFPSNACRLLISELEQSGPETMVCGGIYPSKSVPSEPLVYRGEGLGAFWKWKAGDVFEVTSLGTGCMLIDVEKLKNLPKPWFRTVDGPEKRSDDLYFCDKVRAAGYKIIAHGGVICSHFLYNEKKRAFDHYELDKDSYPMRPVSDQEPHCEREMPVLAIA